jgi:putative endonuclease
MNTKLTGKKGEEIAADYLKRKYYKILDKNFFFRSAGGLKMAEVDIVAKEKDCFVFVEVKTINVGAAEPARFFLAQDKVNTEKQKKVARAAEVWLASHRIPLNVKWRIDVVAVELDKNQRPAITRWIFGPKCKISHFKNITIR